MHVKKLIVLALFTSLLSACGASSAIDEKAFSKSIDLIGGGRLTVQCLPRSYGSDSGTDSVYQYFRILIHDSKEPAAQDGAYVNFGIQEDVHLVSGQDTLMPMIFQRVANGRKEVYEYLAAFECKPCNEINTCAVLIDDKVLGAGKQVVQFP